MAKLTHIDPEGKARMVDVGKKVATRREAVASCLVELSRATLRLIAKNRIAKGEVLNTARIAGIQAAKRTSEIVPLTHPLPLDLVDIETEILEPGIRITCRVVTVAKTGAEMEALTGAAAAALTVYDMVKAVERSARISGLQLEYKSGGKSGVFRRKA
jgi:cyclic pyranopterin phosphate synthase